MTYKEIAKKYLENNGITIGDTIKINKDLVTPVSKETKKK